MLKSVKIRNFSDIHNIEGIEIKIPDAGKVIVLSGRNGTGKTSILKIIKGGSSYRGSSFPFKDCDNDLLKMDIEYTFIDDSTNAITTIKIGKEESGRFKYTQISGGGGEKYSSTKFGELAKKGWNCKFLAAVGSRNSNLDDKIKEGSKNDSKIASKISESIRNVIGASKDLSILTQKSGSAKKRQAKEGGKTINEIFLGKRALAEIFVELYTLEEETLFIVDEVEQALHFDVHERLLEEIKAVAKERRLRVILTTHSPYLYNAANPTQRFLLQRNGLNVSLIPGGTLEAKKELAVSKVRDIYVVEDKRAAAIFRKKFLVENHEEPNLFIGGGCNELFERIDDLQKLYDDNYIAIFDPDTKKEDINTMINERSRGYKWEYLMDSKGESKIPERLLLEFAFSKKSFIPESQQDKILKTYQNLIPILEGLEEGASIDSASKDYKILFGLLIEDVGKEDGLLTAYVSSH